MQQFYVASRNVEKRTILISAISSFVRHRACVDGEITNGYILWEAFEFRVYPVRMNNASRKRAYPRLPSSAIVLVITSMITLRLVRNGRYAAIMPKILISTRPASNWYPKSVARALRISPQQFHRGETFKQGTLPWNITCNKIAML